MDIDPKDPTDVDTFGWDFTAKIEGGDTLDSGKPVTIQSDPVGITVVSGPTFDVPNNSIYAELGGGLSDVIYNVSCTVSTVQGRTWTRRLSFMVQPL